MYSPSSSIIMQLSTGLGPGMVGITDLANDPVTFRDRGDGKLIDDDDDDSNDLCCLYSEVMIIIIVRLEWHGPSDYSHCLYLYMLLLQVKAVPVACRRRRSCMDPRSNSCMALVGRPSTSRDEPVEMMQWL